MIDAGLIGMSNEQCDALLHGELDCHACGRTAIVFYGKLPMCLECKDQAKDLDRRYAKQAAPAARGFRARMAKLGKPLWIFNLAFVCGGLMYLGWCVAAAVYVWIQAGGWSQ